MVSWTRVFTYGTLKCGQRNYYRIEKAIEEGAAKFVGKAKTLDKFPLIIAGRYNIPYILYSKGKGHQINGEVYDVDEDTLKNLDDLEEIPHHYQVEHLTVELLPGPRTLETTTKCLIYVCKNFRPEMLEREFFSDYDCYGGHGLEYSALHTSVDSNYWYDVIVKPDDLNKHA